MKLVRVPKSHLLDASAVDIEHIGSLANTLKTYIQLLAKKHYYKHVEKEQLSKFKARITMYSPYCYGNQTQDNSKCLFDVKTSPYIELILEMLFGEWIITNFSYVVPVGVFKTSVYHSIDVESMSVSKLVKEYPHFIVKVKSVHVRQFVGIADVKDAKRMNYLHYGDKNDHFKRRVTASPESESGWEKLANKLAEQKHSWFKANMKYLGKGSARAVYLLEIPEGMKSDYSIKNGIVVKVAINGKGISQNEHQWDVWDWTRDSKLCPCLGISEDNRVLICCRAEKLKAFNKELKKKLGITVKVASIGYKSPAFEREVLSGQKWEFLNNFDSDAQVHLEHGGTGYTGDYVRPSSWGYYKGRLVLVDYGL